MESKPDVRLELFHRCLRSSFSLVSKNDGRIDKQIDIRHRGFVATSRLSFDQYYLRAVSLTGICFIRTSRPNTEVIYDNEEEFRVGGGKIVRKSGSDKALIIGAGVTLYEGLKV